MLAVIESHGEVESYVTSWDVFSELEELDGTYRTLIMDGPVERSGFRVIDGRMFTAPGEAVIGLGFVQTYGLGVGDSMTVASPVRTELAIVGTFAYEGDLGRVLMYGAESVSGVNSGEDGESPSGNLNLKLVPGADPDALARELLSETDGRILVWNMVELYQESLEDERALIPLMLSLNGILIGLAAANLLIALLFAVRERTKEFGIMKTVGFSPPQIVFTVVGGAVVLAVIGVAIGAPIGYYLTRLWMTQADVEGLPSDLVQVPGITRLALMAPLAAGLAVIGSAVPAVRAAGITVAEALRFE